MAHQMSSQTQLTMAASAISAYSKSHWFDTLAPNLSGRVKFGDFKTDQFGDFLSVRFPT